MGVSGTVESIMSKLCLIGEQSVAMQVECALNHCQKLSAHVPRFSMLMSPYMDTILHCVKFPRLSYMDHGDGWKFFEY
jgi:hypothetical protein